MYNFEVQFDENLMFKDNFESSKAISVCCRIISFVPKYIFSVSGYRHMALLILFYMKKKKKNTENNLDMKRLQCCLGFTPTVAN